MKHYSKRLWIEMLLCSPIQPFSYYKTKHHIHHDEQRLTCHGKLSKGHSLQERAEQLAGCIFEAEEQTDSLAVVKLCQAPMLLPQVFIPHLSHN